MRLQYNSRSRAIFARFYYKRLAIAPKLIQNVQVSIHPDRENQMLNFDIIQGILQVTVIFEPQMAE